MAANRIEVCNLPTNQPWFWSFLKDELKPYPNRLYTVGRMVLSATLTMLVVMTMRSPNSAVGVFFGLLISRENPASTVKAGVQIILAFIAGLIYTLVGVTIFVNDPLPHFIFITVSLALMFFMIRTARNFSIAFGFCFIVVSAIPVWDLPFPVDAHVDTNIWSVFGIILAVCITILVELIFCPKQKTTEEISKGLTHRLTALQSLFQAYLDEKPLPLNLEIENIKQLARLGTRRLKWYLTRSDMGDETGIKKAQWGSYISTVERLVDTASNLGVPRKSLTDQDKSRLLALQNACQELQAAILSETSIPPERWSFPINKSRALPLLSELERKLQQMPHISGEISLEPQKVNLNQVHWQQFLVADAFTNAEYFHFAVKGTLTGLACYVFYSAVDWPGLGNSLATCVITALSTVGSSRQKQILRIGGAIFGGLILGMGSQIYILPQLDTILGFSIFFALITAVAAWFTTSSPRLSYFGLQMALAFYLIMFQSTAIETSLSIGRDRVMGTLVGLIAMWGIFDQMWVKPAIEEMKEAFAENMRHLGELTGVMLSGPRSIETMDVLRDKMNDGFNKMDRNADMMLFEFGKQRAQHLYWRAKIENWQNAQESLLLAQLAVNHYRRQMQIADWPDSLQKALFQFNEALAGVWNAIGQRIVTNPQQPLRRNTLKPLLAHLREEVVAYFETQHDTITLHEVDAIMDLDEQMVNITEALILEVSVA